MFLGRINMTRKTKVMTLTKITIIPIISINHFLIIIYVRQTVSVEVGFTEDRKYVIS